MSLVAYNDSDHDSDNEETKVEASLVETNQLKNSDPSNEIVDSDDDELSANIRSNELKILPNLPGPIKPQKSYTEEDVLEDIVKPKSVHLEYAPKPPRKRKRIVVDFSHITNESDEEVEELPKPTVNSKSGLLTMLPSAKTGQPTIKTAKQMLPYTLKKTAMQDEKLVNNVKKPTIVNANNDKSDSDSDDGDNVTSSFFTFEDTRPATNTTYETNTLPSYVNEGEEESKFDNGIVDSKDTFGPSLPPDSIKSSYMYPEIEDVVHKEEMKKIQGKQLSFLENVQFVDVKTDEILGDAKANVIKNLTSDEDLAQMNKVAKMEAPSSNAKRKHQITYLAHQAQVRELEFKNTWAQNKMNKQASRNKYGF